MAKGGYSFYQDNKKKRRKTNSRKGVIIRRTIIITAEVLLLTVILVCAYLLSKLDKATIVDLDTDVIQTNSMEDATYGEQVSATYSTYVVFGIDKESYNSDVNLLISINNVTNEIRLCSVYRDTYLRMTTGDYAKVNSALNARGVQDAISTLNTNLDLDIDGYFIINWTAVIKAINELGGVELTITDDLLYRHSDGMPLLNGYITELVETTGIGSTQIQEAGTYLCDGVQAVAYARVRHNDSDYNRTERQREVISQMFLKAKNLALGGNLLALNAVADDVLSEVEMSLSVNDVLSMLTKILDYTIADQTGFPFTKNAVNGWMGDSVVPINLAENVEQLHEFLYGSEDYTASSTVKEISEEIRIEAGYDENWELESTQAATTAAATTAATTAAATTEAATTAATTAAATTEAATTAATTPETTTEEVVTVTTTDTETTPAATETTAEEGTVANDAPEADSNLLQEEAEVNPAE